MNTLEVINDLINRLDEMRFNGYMVKNPEKNAEIQSEARWHYQSLILLKKFIEENNL